MKPILTLDYQHSGHGGVAEQEASGGRSGTIISDEDSAGDAGINTGEREPERRNNGGDEESDRRSEGHTRQYVRRFFLSQPRAKLYSNGLVACFHRSLKKVDDTMADMADQTAIANEISSAISNPMYSGNEIDEVSVLIIGLLTVLSHSYY